MAIKGIKLVYDDEESIELVLFDKVEVNTYMGIKEYPNLGIVTKEPNGVKVTILISAPEPISRLLFDLINGNIENLINT